MIGNDLVSLERLDQRKSGNLRFLQKIFTKREQDHIQNSKNPELLLWQFWCAKESAYKSHQRIFQLDRKLNPLDFEVDISNFKVFIDNSEYQIHFKQVEGFMYSETISSSEKFKTVFYKGKRISSAEIPKSIGLKSDFKIIKNRLGIPSILHKTTLKKFPISISHEKGMSSFLFPLINY